MHAQALQVAASAPGLAPEKPDAQAQAAMVARLRQRLAAEQGAAVEQFETHISLVLVCGEHAYKIKKDLRNAFLDQSTLVLRQRACEEELRLNRRLAADLYLAVVPITGTAAAPEIGGEGVAIEFAV
jgi:aminoglycoside phosphotransferase family enzyme